MTSGRFTRRWGAVLAVACLFAVPGVASACSGAKLVPARDVPNADGAVVGSVFMTLTERRAVRDGDPEVLRVIARNGHSVELRHTFILVSEVVHGDVNSSLVDVVDFTAGCGITQGPGERLGVLLNRNEDLLIGSMFSTTTPRALLAVQGGTVVARSFTADVLAGYAGLTRVLAAPHDRPEVD
ncbi:MAG: hypothetical protein JWN72_767 [Thermoleophilia bacterium]|nr:hypothetical protein [Thermoleophilia bacterium]